MEDYGNFLVLVNSFRRVRSLKNSGSQAQSLHSLYLFRENLFPSRPVLGQNASFSAFLSTPAGAFATGQTEEGEESHW